METSVPAVRTLPTAAAGAARQRRARTQTAALEPCGAREPRAGAKPRALPAPQSLLTARDLLYPAPCPHHTALTMLFLMLCCPEGVCLSFPWQSSAGCAEGPHPRPQSQPPPSRADEVG